MRSVVFAALMLLVSSCVHAAGVSFIFSGTLQAGTTCKSVSSGTMVNNIVTVNVVAEPTGGTVTMRAAVAAPGTADPKKLYIDWPAGASATKADDQLTGPITELCAVVSAGTAVVNATAQGQ